MTSLLKLIRKSPSRLFRYACQHAGRFRQSIPADAKFFHRPDRQVFFGYYDITPFSADGQRLLACLAPAGNRTPHGNHPELELGYYDLASPGSPPKIFAATKTWNWQQGCRLQWFPNQENPYLVAYNTLNEGCLVTAIHDVREASPHRYLPLPTYSLSNDGRNVLSLNFTKLHRLRPGYGYSNIPEEDHDGVDLHDLDSGETRKVLTMEAVVSHRPETTMQDAQHYLNHLCFSPDGSRFMLMHLWIDPERKRNSRMLIVDCDGKILFTSGMLSNISHYAWYGNDRVLLTGTHRDSDAKYCEYDISDASARLLTHPALTRDGHPSYVDECCMITDTYPDKFRIQTLFLQGIKDNKTKILAGFYMPRRFTQEVRCDLHPRLDVAHKLACVDMVRNGKRAMCLLPLPDFNPPDSHPDTPRQ